MKKLFNTLYVTNKDAYVCKKDDNACVRVDGKDVLRVPLHLLEGIVLFNYAGASAPLLYACAARGISVFSMRRGDSPPELRVRCRGTCF